MSDKYKKSRKNERFSEVLDEIKKATGDSQRKIIESLQPDYLSDEYFFAELKSGKRKRIPDGLISALHKHYRINPDYLNLKSDYMWDDLGIKLDYLLKCIDKYFVLEDEDNNHYLHLKIDSNLVNLLISLGLAFPLISDLDSIKGNDMKARDASFEQEKEALIQKYSTVSNPMEYVLIPRNELIKLVKQSDDDQKRLYDVLDLLDLKPYLEAKPVDNASSSSFRKNKKDILDNLSKEAKSKNDDIKTS